jgi:hypothetical protein
MEKNLVGGDFEARKEKSKIKNQNVKMWIKE